MQLDTTGGDDKPKVNFDDDLNKAGPIRHSGMKEASAWRVKVHKGTSGGGRVRGGRKVRGGGREFGG